MSRYGSALVNKLLTHARKQKGGGFTLIELLIVTAILGTLAGIAIPSYSGYINKARITKGIAEISMLQKEILAFEAMEESFPGSLADIGRENLMDPYGNPYQYANFTGKKGYGGMRKDNKNKPLNVDYDLYSLGRDGKTTQNLLGIWAHDDIIRAADGRFIGLASEF